MRFGRRKTYGVGEAVRSSSPGLGGVGRRRVVPASDERPRPFFLLFPL